jgi:hypothetical protein
MGLDQYLTKKLYVKRWEHTPAEKLYTVTAQRGDGGYTSIKPDRVSYIEEEAGYWRKANQVHRWFVENVQNGEDDCGQYYVSNEQLEELLNICKKIKEDSSLAQQLLPTQNGFFFGDTEYGEWYMMDINTTIEILEPLLFELNEARENGEYPEIYYSSSW